MNKLIKKRVLTFSAIWIFIGAVLLSIPFFQNIFLIFGGKIIGRALNYPDIWIRRMQRTSYLLIVASFLTYFLATLISKKFFVSKTLILWFLLSLVFTFLAINHLTYFEFTTQTPAHNNYTVLANSNNSLSVTFNSPYDIIRGLSFHLKQLTEQNDSSLSIELKELASTKILAKKDFNIKFSETPQWYFVNFGKNIWTNKTKTYEIKIYPKNIPTSSVIAVYFGNENPALRIHGGEFDIWWLCLCLIWNIFLLLILLRYFNIKKKGCSVLDDKIFTCMAICGIVFMLMFFFKDAPMFLDENDNFHGGILISHGKVLYRDYITQHTPFAYYLCSLFALLGAKSTEQFRLSFYLLEGIIFALLYLRHSDYFGQKRMLILPIFEIIILNITVPDYGYLVLSDIIQGICFITLLLEYLRYCDDGIIDWKRAVIVSLCICFSFGSAFMSVYALIWIFFAVAFSEIRKIIKKEVSFYHVFIHIYRLSTALLIPLAITTLYFILNHSFKEAIRQSYVFNRQIYSNYQPYGKSLFQPFTYSIINFGNELRNTIHIAIFSKEYSKAFLELLVLLCSVVFSINTFIKNKNYLSSFIPFIVMIMSGIRGYSMHGIAAWNVAILIIVIFSKDFCIEIPKRFVPFFIFFSLYLSFPFWNAIYNGIFRGQLQISELESLIIDSTYDKEDILFDAFSCDSNYLFAKRHFPINRTVYMLPWYMDWYESDTISELKQKRPRFALFKKDSDYWSLRNLKVGEALKIDYIEIYPSLWQRRDSLQKED